MSTVSCGILAWRRRNNVPQVLLVHPGGPFFAKKDDGAWSVPKGICEEGEDPLNAARREFAEELGMEIEGHFTALAPVKQKGGKTVYAWAIEADVDISQARSNTFTMMWPPRSGKMAEFPEVDKAEWFGAAEARRKINAAQAALIDEWESRIAGQ